MRTALMLTAITLVGCSTLGPERPPAVADDGLVRVPSAEFDLLYVLPDTRLDRFETVYIAEPDVSFERGWQNQQNIRDANRISDDDMARIEARLKELLTQEFRQKLTLNTGYRLTDTPDEKTLIVKPEIVDLFIENPFNTRGYQINVVGRNAGAMTLNVELRDHNGAALLRFSDRRRARYFGSLQGGFEEQDVVKNYREGLFALRTWAASLTELLNDSAYAG